MPAPASVAAPGSAATAVIAGQSPEQVSVPAQSDVEPSVLLIGSPSAEQIAQALIDHLAPEVIAAVREFLT
ncbi:hypothetical protein [Kitasatospora cineracea]|uniref:hypothetical protein n=1 Tax=Kitasatospora cineracea TaxID=88074 RepID=UPI000F502ED0|nr:hypothetical protein [Kitasatospora cineracea]